MLIIGIWLLCILLFAVVIGEILYRQQKNKSNKKTMVKQDTTDIDFGNLSFEPQWYQKWQA